MGTKSQRQNQHVNRLMKKIVKFKRKNRNADGLEKELAYTMGDKTRPEFKTGAIADARIKRQYTG